MTELDRYAVFGNPIKHSRSPQIHAAFAAQTDQRLSYRAHLIELGGFERGARDFFTGGGKGINITVPFKLDAFAFADELSGRARRAGACDGKSALTPIYFHGAVASKVRHFLYNVYIIRRGYERGAM